jgi:hypothetical protein
MWGQVVVERGWRDPAVAAELVGRESNPAVLGKGRGEHPVLRGGPSSVAGYPVDDRQILVCS